MGAPSLPRTTPLPFLFFDSTPSCRIRIFGTTGGGTVSGIGIASIPAARALRCGNDLIGNLVEHILQTGSGLQKTMSISSVALSKVKAWVRRLTGKTNGADETYVDYVVVAETDRSEIDCVLWWYCEGGVSEGGWREIYRLAHSAHASAPRTAAYVEIL